MNDKCDKLRMRNFFLNFITTSLLFVGLSTFADENRKLKVKVYTCDKGKIDSKNYLINTFVVEKYKVSIYPEIYISGTKFVPPPNILEDCLVKDNNNWICGGKVKTLNGRRYLDHTFRVRNGKYSHEAGNLLPLNEGCSSNAQWVQLN